MSNFNEYFRNHGCEIIVNRFFNNTDIYNPKVKITSLNYSFVDEPPMPASYYIENELTASHKVRLEYTTSDSDEIKYSEFEIPMEIDGAFIIEGAYRIATNKLGSDYDCRIKMSGTGDYIINFDYDRRYDISKRVLKIKKINLDLGISDKSIEIKFEDLDSVSEEQKELLKLSEKQQKKFMIKLDLDYKPEYISQKLIQDCLNFGDDRAKDLIIDKTIESVSEGFMQYIFRSNNGRNYFSARSRITAHFTKYSKLQDQITAITTLAFRYFKGSADKGKGDTSLQVPPGVNAINLESLSSKITIPESVAYNATMSDLIDIADTPINNNTNLQNSMTISTHVTDDKVLFDVYDKNFQKITIEYIDYLNSKVCASEFVDYDNLQLKPNTDNMVEVKYRMRRKMVPVEEIELIDLHPDYRLSSTTRRIPFINYTDSVRISMGTSMLKQSIPLVNAQNELVRTGRNEELENNILNEKFNHDEGVVKEINEDKVIIQLKDKDKTKIEIPRRTAIQSINDVSVYTEPKVKVGQIVKKGDIITGAVGLGKETYKAGVNTLVLFSAFFGKVNEDALVISESFANRIASYSIIDLSIDIRTSSCLKWIAPIGTKVKSGSNVVTLFAGRRLDEINKALNEKLGGLFGEDGKNLTEFTEEEHLKVPNNIDEAWVADVMIQENTKAKVPKSIKKPDYTFVRESEKPIHEYMKTKDEDRKKYIYTKFPEYIAADKLRPINLDNKIYKTVYTVRIRLIKRTIGMKGSKITNRYGGKGVVSEVRPDNIMPIMIEKGTGKKYTVEVIMNPYSTINRKISGVLIEAELGQIANRLRDIVDSYKTTKTGQKKIMPLITKYYPGRYDNLSVEEFLNLHESKPIEDVYYFEVGCYSNFSPEKVDEWMNELGLEAQSEILMPESEVTDLSELEENLSPEEYAKAVKQLEGKFVKVDKKLQCGWLTLEELYHIPTYSNKVTTSLQFINGSGAVNYRRDEPILGRGRYRQTGQKIGEMELSVLLSRNATNFIEGSRKDTAREDNQVFLNNMLGLGMTIVDEKGYNQGGSDLKTQIGNMKKKFRIKGQK